MSEEKVAFFASYFKVTFEFVDDVLFLFIHHCKFYLNYSKFMYHLNLYAIE